MCQHMLVRADSKPMEGFGLQANFGSHERENSSGGGVGNYFLASNACLHNILKLSFFKREILFAYSDPFFRSIEHIPKA